MSKTQTARRRIGSLLYRNATAAGRWRHAKSIRI